MQRSPADQPRSQASSAPPPYCLACGYDWVGLDGTRPCPECGEVSAEEHRAEADRAFRRPLRRAWNECRGRVPRGWWCLIPGDARLAARLQLVVGLTATTTLLLLFIVGGAHVRLWFAAHPIRTAIGAEGETTLIDNAILSGLVPGDIGWGQRPGARPFTVSHPAGQPPAVPTIDVVRPNWSPYFLTSTIWTACLPAAGLLGLRFLLLPLVLRIGRRTLTPALQASARVAADASVASTAIACCAMTIGVGIVAFLLPAVLPARAGTAIVAAMPSVILGLQVLLPPLVFATVIWHDRARRVFPWPKAAAAMTFASYFGGLAIGAGMIAATFTIVVRSMV